MTSEEIAELLENIKKLRAEREFETAAMEKHRLRARQLSEGIRGLEAQLPDKRIVNKVERMKLEPATVAIKPK